VSNSGLAKRYGIILAFGLWVFATATACAAEPKAEPSGSQSSVDSRPQAAPQTADDDLDEAEATFAARGFIMGPRSTKIVDENGRIVRNLQEWQQFSGPSPKTVNPSLWNRAKLINRAGLYKVADRIYQVRGLDYANITFVRGNTGLIVIDTTMTKETAAAALDLIRSHLGPLPVTAIIYTHSHADHYGGASGLVSKDESLLAGPAMQRRATYMLGMLLPVGPTGNVGLGSAPAFGTGVGNGTVSLIPPSDLIRQTGETRMIDGLKFVFQLTPDTEAPAEMNIFIPGLRALCMAENANITMHNFGTLRGAAVRDSRAWAQHLTESLDMFADDADVVFLGHGWPIWGTKNIRTFLSSQRDLYAFLHDQTLRLMNDGYTPVEISQRLSIPPSLASRWYNRPYYGSVKQNVQAIYQRYLGWYKGNPVELDPLSPTDEANKMVEAMGGSGKVLSLAQDAVRKKEFRWAATLLGKLVFSDQRSPRARTELAAVLRQLAYRSENSVWRNEYLTGAMELELGRPALSGQGQSGNPLRALPLQGLIDLMAVRLVPDASITIPLSLDVVDSKTGVIFALDIENSVLLSKQIDKLRPAVSSLTIGSHGLADILSGQDAKAVINASGAIIDGEEASVWQFLDHFKPPQANFNIMER